MMASNICEPTSALWPFDDFNKNTMAPKLAIEAAMTNKNKNVRLESCSLAIFRTSRGWDDRMIIQSIRMIVEAKLIQVNRITAGRLCLLYKQKKVIIAAAKEINKR